MSRKEKKKRDDDDWGTAESSPSSSSGSNSSEDPAVPPRPTKKKQHASSSSSSSSPAATSSSPDIDFEDVCEYDDDDDDGDDEEDERVYERLLLKKDSALTVLQREAVDWLASREVDAGGGLLTDEMGLGKTLSILYLVARDKRHHHHRASPTLVVCPPMLFDTWEGEVTRHFKPGVLRVARYGDSENRQSLEDAKAGRIDRSVDVLLTSYDRLYIDLREHLSLLRLPTDGGEPRRTLADRLLSEKSFRRTDRAMLLLNSPIADKVDVELITVRDPIAPRGLFGVHWQRVVLDEAHKACNAETAKFRAAMCLSADRRWWVTGTPVQNRYTDAVTALLFVREPTICYENTEVPRKEQRPDPKMSDQDYRASKVFQRWAFGRSIQSIVDQRLEMIHDDPVLNYMSRLEFNKFEHAVRFRHTEERQAHLKHVRRLRRVAQLLADKGGEGVSSDSSSSFDSKIPLSAAVPLEQQEEENAVRREIDAMMQDGKRTNEVLFVFYTRARQVAVDLTLAGEPPLPGGAHSTKIQLLVDDIRSKVPKEDKFLVFSEWVEALEIAGSALKRAGINVLLVHGRMSMTKRRQALRRFKDTEDEHAVRGLVVQIDCVGLGLTLTEANHVFQLEPMPNPHRELQAFGRIRRPGQTKNMNIYWLMIAGSIDEVVRSVAAKKLRMGQRIQGKKERSALNSIELLRDINLLTLSSSGEDLQYRERDGELEYRRGLAARKRFEVPPGLAAPLSRKQLDERFRAFLGAFTAYETVRSLPSGSVLWHMTTEQREAQREIEARRDVAAAGGDGGMMPIVNSDALAVALDPLRLRRWLYDEFYVQFKRFELERNQRRSAGIYDEMRSNYEELASIVAVQKASQMGRSSVDPVRANLPRDFLNVLSLVGRPLLTLYYTEELLVAERHVFGTYNSRNVTTELVTVKGDSATRLRASKLYPRRVELDAKVLVAYLPFWLDARVADVLPVPASVYPETLFQNPGELWITPPLAAAAGAELSPPIELHIEDRSQPQTTFMHDVRDLLMPLIADGGSDSSLATCVLATLLVAPVWTPSIERRLFVARRRRGAATVIGVATAIVLRNMNVQPQRPVVAVVAPAVYIASQLRDTQPEAMRHIVTSLARRLTASLFDHRQLSFSSQPTLDPLSLVVGTSYRVFVVAGQINYLEFLVRNVGDAASSWSFEKKAAAPANASSTIITTNWPVESNAYVDGFLSWRVSQASPIDAVME